MAAAAVCCAAPLTLELNAPLLRGVDVAQAQLSVNLSASAYCNEQQVRAWTCVPCVGSGLKLDVLDFFYAKETDTNGYVGVDHDNERIIVAFMGTRDIKQWIENFDFVKRPLPYPGASAAVEVHAGFLRSYLTVKRNIDTAINKTLASHAGYKLHITGHSLGAALATLCTLDLRQQHPSVDMAQYTFGQPRVGNAEFSDFFQNLYKDINWRFTHYRDPVPHLPLEDMGFRHIPTEVFYTQKYEGPSSLKVCDGSGEDKTCSDQYVFDTDVSDHLNYLGMTLSSSIC